MSEYAESGLGGAGYLGSYGDPVAPVDVPAQYKMQTSTGTTRVRIYHRTQSLPNASVVSRRGGGF